MRDILEDSTIVAGGLLLLALAFTLPIVEILLLSVRAEGGGLTLGHFGRLLADDYFAGVAWRTIRLSVVITLACVAIGFPLAYVMARTGPSLRLWLIVLTALPLMTSVVVRTFGWMVLLGRGGLVPVALWKMGLVGRNFTLMQTEIAVVVGMIHILLPFMALSIMSVIMNLDRRLEEAARTMGCSFTACLRTVVLPLSAPGIVAGSLLVFTLSLSYFITPSLLGGVRNPVLSSAIYETVTKTFEWHFAAAQSVALLTGILLVLVPYFRIAGGRNG
jgi:putative spermidine/putrescine transport system permease protein